MVNIYRKYSVWLSWYFVTCVVVFGWFYLHRISIFCQHYKHEELLRMFFFPLNTPLDCDFFADFATELIWLQCILTVPFLSSRCVSTQMIFFSGRKRPLSWMGWMWLRWRNFVIKLKSMFFRQRSIEWWNSSSTHCTKIKRYSLHHLSMIC